MSIGALDKWWTHRGHLFLWSPLLELVFGAAVECGRAMSHLTRHPIHILKGGYERFSAMYHFFRTQKIIWMPQVRQGAWAQAGLDGAWPSPEDHGMGCRIGQRGEGDRQHRKKWKKFWRLGLRNELGVARRSSPRWWIYNRQICMEASMAFKRWGLFRGQGPRRVLDDRL